MPRASRPCPEPGCWQLQPCDTHKLKPWATSTRASRLPKDWNKRRAKVLKRDGYHCRRCGAKANEVDHVIANDDHALTNLQSLCEPCHRTKTQQESAAARWPNH